MILLLKKGIIVLCIFIVVMSLILGVRVLARILTVEKILILGIYHLEEKDILRGINIKKGESLLNLSLKEVMKKLRRNPWIKKVSLRKQFPDTLLIKIEETTPKALLNLNNHMFLIDEEGNILERVRNKSIPFLPVIKNINPKNIKAILEALKLIDVLNEKGILRDKGSIEIGLRPYGLQMNIDGEIIKVGYGKYTEKLERWRELEPEIRKRGIPIQYVDLRFKDSVIVKPIKNLKSKDQNPKLWK